MHGGSFMDLFGKIVTRCCSEDVQLIAVLAKKIWMRRNVVVHGGEFCHPNKLVQEAEAMLVLFSGEPCLQGRNVHGVEEPISWKPPSFGHYKLNWDMALDDKNKLLGVGIIVRDCKGLLHAAQSKTYFCSHPPVMAEAMGALRAVELCRDLGFQDVVLEGDSLIVVQNIRNPAADWSAHGQIIADVRMVLQSRRSWMIGHVKRDANQAAHGLTKYAVRNQVDRVWLDEVPNCISAVVDVELSALSI